MEGEGAPRIRREARLAAGAGCGLGALGAVLEPALKEAAGSEAACVSVSLEFATPPPEAAAVVVEAWVERATRTLMFVAAEVRVDSHPAVTASAIFSRG